MALQESSGQNSQPQADLDREVYALFRAHPKASTNDANEPVIPGDALVDILRTFSANKQDAGELMSRDEEEQLVQLLDSNPGLEVTPQVLLQFIAQRAALSPEATSAQPPSPEAREIVLGRGRPGEKTEYVYYSHSRSSSQDTTAASVYRPHSRPPSRGPSSVGPNTSASRDSPFDVSARQRSTPLAAPSSWARRPPPSRRKSDAGSRSHPSSDSESSMSPPPVAFSRSQGRLRTPSVPTTPGSHARTSGTLSPISIGTPPFGGSISRPHSRTQSYPSNHFPSFGSATSDYQYNNVDDDDDDYGYGYNEPFNRQTGMMSPQSDQSDLSMELDERPNRRTMLTMLRMSHDSDPEDGPEDEDPTYGPKRMRQATVSTASLSLQERLEALQKANEDLMKKAKDAEDSLQRKLSEHEGDLDNMQQEIDELTVELSLTRKSEKELKSKERTNVSEIQSLENQITNLTLGLDNSRAAHTNMTNLYHEQCAEANRIRDLLLKRDEDIRHLKEANMLQAVEARKWEDELTQWQNQVKVLEEELAAAHKAQTALDDQKRENMMLKETIDRMRFEMDEMRQAATNHAATGLSSTKASISRSLGAELAGRLKDNEWEVEDDEPTHEAEEQERDVAEDNDTEDEDIVETIITRTKRKVASRAKRVDSQLFEEVKEYSDASIQHDIVTGTFAVQTDPEPRPVVSVASMQTDEPSIASMEIQTDPEPVRHQPVTTEMAIQTDEVAAELFSSIPDTTEADDDALASSSSTLIPATPKAEKAELHVHDLPPTYNQVTQDELAIRVADETLKTWHKGLKLPIQAVEGGISEEAVEDWTALKAELGVECSAIDRIVQESARTGFPRPNKEARRRSRFYNIYNTYVYGSKGYTLLSNSQIMFLVGATAASAFLLGQFMTLQSSSLGGPTYYDRAAWSSFNSIQATGEGFPGDAHTAFWGFVGRIGGGAARTLRGFPT